METKKNGETSSNDTLQTQVLDLLIRTLYLIYVIPCAGIQAQSSCAMVFRRIPLRLPARRISHTRPDKRNSDADLSVTANSRPIKKESASSSPMTTQQRLGYFVYNAEDAGRKANFHCVHDVPAGQGCFSTSHSNVKRVPFLLTCYVKLRCDAQQRFPAPCSRCEKQVKACVFDPRFKRQVVRG